jgi:hypothetical protein
MMANTVLVDNKNYYNATEDDDIILIDASEMGDITVTLPMHVENGKIFAIKNIRHTTKTTQVVIGNGGVYFDYYYPSIQIPGAGCCEVVHYNGCYHVLNIVSL